MEAGHLVSDDIIMGVVREELAKPAAAKGVIFDGVVRTIPAGRRGRAAAVRAGPADRRGALLRCHRRGDPRAAGQAPPDEQRADDDPAAVATRLEAYRHRPHRCWSGMSSGAGLRRIPAIGAIDEIANRVRQDARSQHDHAQVPPRDRDHEPAPGGSWRGRWLIREILRPGVSTEELDAEAERFIRSHDGAIPSFKGLYGFPKTLCTSIDEEIVHGIPSRRRMLREGSIVSVDVGCSWRVFTPIRPPRSRSGRSAETDRLLRVTQECLAAGIAEARVGNHVGDIGYAVQRVAEEAGYGVVRELVGHGIGTRFHEEPQVPNYGAPKRGPRLLEGMTLAIEPMITMGSPATKTLPDKWTVVTADGSLSAHFEHTVAITANGPRILTTS